MALWVKFEDGSRACVERPADMSHDDWREKQMDFASDLAGKQAVEAWSLPYPANPRLNKVAYNEKAGPCPPFCYSPDQCKGRSSCPKSYACSE